MSHTDTLTLGYAFGFTFTVSLFCVAAYYLFAIFGIGYIGAELMAGYMGWNTIYQWDTIVGHYQALVDQESIK